ncbi:MAG: hypothetical protein CLLPBCKN_006735 [Chroococcidiopsis cubana SAG 39.79]|nr:hypothetical protein [Chroococcidiopsis cubana SAG 39.79]
MNMNKLIAAIGIMVAIASSIWLATSISNSSPEMVAGRPPTPGKSFDGVERN